MSAPALWIGIPLTMGAVSFLLLSDRTVARAGGITCLMLALIALIIPIDEALLVGPLSIKIASTASLLGRSLVIPAGESALLVMLFGLCSMWFFGSEAAGVARQLVPAGLVITGLLIAALAVQPFLYAALMVDIAALAAIPLLAPSGRPPSRAVVKFLIYQTLGMPCILLAGWLLAGVETSPGDLALTIQATVMLSLGFAFLLAIFPLSDWIPGLMGASHPYVAGFVLWILPNVILVFGLSFLDNYAWLRTSTQITTGLRVLGLIMLVSSGLAAAVERNLGRLMGHVVIAETGLTFLAASLAIATGTNMVFPFFIPRGLGLILWALALAVAREGYPELTFQSLGDIGRTRPWAGAGLVLASLSAAGFPLLAGFPARIDVWAGLAGVSSASAIWYMLGLAGLMIGALRMLAQLLGPRTDEPAVPEETSMQRAMLGAAMVALIGLGLFPRATEFLVTRFPYMFEHLAR
ncbi:MAG TPA: hypothetical protein VIU38_11940 [Anaerolineales bacterium]